MRGHLFSHAPTDTRVDENHAILASGNYRIVYCAQHAPRIAQLLHSIWATIQEALEGIDSAGPRGTPLYNTFFAGVDPATVAGVLSRVATGASIHALHGAGNPTIVCDNPHVPNVVGSDAHAECAKVRGLLALWVEQSNTVFLCEQYLRSGRLEPVAKYCVGDRPGGGYSTGILLAETQWAVLFHELVHLYLDGPYLKNEARGIFAAVDLPPEQAVINPSSYVFFLASMSATTSASCLGGEIAADVMGRGVDIKAGCSVYKPKASLRPPERKLLDNSTAGAQALATDLVLSTTNCTDGNLDVGLGLCAGKKSDVVFDLEPSITAGSAVSMPTGMSTSFVASRLEVVSQLP